MLSGRQYKVFANYASKVACLALLSVSARFLPAEEDSIQGSFPDKGKMQWSFKLRTNVGKNRSHISVSSFPLRLEKT